MRLCIQRVIEASVEVDNVVIGQISHGLLVFLGVGQGDTRETADRYIKKLLNLRMFEDENGKTNLDLKQVSGELLIISQFTLYADCSHGNRPSFIEAGAPQQAKELYNYFVEQCSNRVTKVATGEFGAEMKVSLTNEGPFTILLDERTFA